MNSTNSISFLQSIDLFSDLGDETLAFLCDHSKLQYYNTGEILYYEKEQRNEIFFLVNGGLKFYKVDRFDNEIFLYKLGANSLVFDISRMCDQHTISCYANAEFMEASEVLVFEGDKFKEVIQRDTLLMQKILQESFRSIQQLQCIISRDVVFDGTAKVAHMIVNELDTFNSLKKHEIAYMLHIQPETLSRILKKLTRNGIVCIEKNNVVILDENELREIYE